MLRVTDEQKQNKTSYDRKRTQKTDQSPESQLHVLRDTFSLRCRDAAS